MFVETHAEPRQGCGEHAELGKKLAVVGRPSTCWGSVIGWVIVCHGRAWV